MWLWLILNSHCFPDSISWLGLDVLKWRPVWGEVTAFPELYEPINPPLTGSLWSTGSYYHPPMSVFEACHMHPWTIEACTPEPVSCSYLNPSPTAGLHWEVWISDNCQESGWLAPLKKKRSGWLLFGFLCPPTKMRARLCGLTDVILHRTRWKQDQTRCSALWHIQPEAIRQALIGIYLLWPYSFVF